MRAVVSSIPPALEVGQPTESTVQDKGTFGSALTAGIRVATIAVPEAPLQQGDRCRGHQPERDAASPDLTSGPGSDHFHDRAPLDDSMAWDWHPTCNEKARGRETAAPSCA